MNEHKKKMVAPILCAALMIVYYAVYFGFLITLLSGVWKFALGLFPIAFAALTVYVCIERMKEIRSGEEDDLSQY